MAVFMCTISIDFIALCNYHKITFTLKVNSYTITVYCYIISLLYILFYLVWKPTWFLPGALTPPGIWWSCRVLEY